MGAQVVQLCGSAMILAPFVLAQLGRLRTDDVAFLVLNLAGSATLAVQAAATRQWGFLLLEGVWAVVSLHSLLGRHRPVHPPGGGGGTTSGAWEGPASGGRGRS